MVSQEVKDKYEAVIGLEVHAQMFTKSKAYSSDPNEYGQRPNTNVSVETLGHPGTLPLMNKKTIEYAIRLGLALECKIANYQYFDRKNYFYPDLPNGYQITQDRTPICTEGKIELSLGDGLTKIIRITRIHMEEDTGKSLHDVDLYDTLLDLNRAGTPLLEIVTEPDLRSGEEAYAYLHEIRQLVRHLDICDGNMEEGNLRCDANVSVRKIGTKEFGERVEVKNMNSMRNVQRAINFEIERHIGLLENNKKVLPETRSFDAVNSTTFSMRTKSEENDYRFFPEPNLQPLYISKEQIKSEMPELPKVLFKKYTRDLNLTAYDATHLISSKSFANYFEQAIKFNQDYKSIANWMNGPIRSYMNQYGKGIEEFPISPEKITLLIEQIQKGVVSTTVAEQKIFPVMLENPDIFPEDIIKELNLTQDSDEDSLTVWINEVIDKNKDEVGRYRNGEKQLLGFFMGQVMKMSKGKADPSTTNQLMRKILEN